VIAVPEPGAWREPTYRSEDQERASQQSHLERLRVLGRYPEVTFGNFDQLAANVLRSSVLDLLAGAERDENRRAHERQAGIWVTALLIFFAAVFSWAAYSLSDERFFSIIYAVLSFCLSVAAIMRLQQYLRRRPS
jgi:hypothetical protein